LDKSFSLVRLDFDQSFPILASAWLARVPCFPINASFVGAYVGAITGVE
jgi:hypothetical protein